MKLNNISPSEYICVVGACPQLYATDRDSYIIIGTKLKKDQIIAAGLVNNLSDNEIAIEIPKGLIKKAKLD